MDGFKDTTRVKYEGAGHGRASSDVGAAVERGNRTPYERMPRDLSAGAPVKRRDMATPPPRSAEVRPQTDLQRKLSTVPPRKAEPAPKGRFRDVPLIGGALDAVGLKKGGKVSKKC